MDAEKYFDILRQDREQSEQRMRDQLTALDARLSAQNEKSEERINRAMDEIRQDFRELRGEFKESQETSRETKRWTIGIFVTIVLALLGFVFSLLPILVDLASKLQLPVA